MTIRFKCPNCQSVLHAVDSDAGKTWPCPKRGCGEIVRVPTASRSVTSTSAQSGGNEQRTGWRVHNRAGQEFGPVHRTVLDAWIAEGRVEADDLVLPEGEDRWRPAHEFYAELRRREDVTETAEPIDASSELRLLPGERVLEQISMTRFALTFSSRGVVFSRANSALTLTSHRVRRESRTLLRGSTKSMMLEDLSMVSVSEALSGIIWLVLAILCALSAMVDLWNALTGESDFASVIGPIVGAVAFGLLFYFTRRVVCRVRLFSSSGESLDFVMASRDRQRVLAFLHDVDLAKQARRPGAQ